MFGTSKLLFRSSVSDTTPPATPVVEIVMMYYDSLNAEVLTYEDGGTVYWMLVDGAGPADAAGIIDGMHSNYVAHGSINFSTAGIQSVVVNSLSPETTYWLGAVHRDAALNSSEVAYDSAATPPAP
jgi:hypothetical protein